jgi:hypothetical protein
MKFLALGLGNKGSHATLQDIPSAIYVGVAHLSACYCHDLDILSSLAVIFGGHAALRNLRGN